MVNLFGGKYKGKTILLTGNTGFKGSWMAHWLTKIGAHVIGFSKDIPSEPSHYNLLMDTYDEFVQGDVSDRLHLEKVFGK